jgi:SH3-like domain-containing protein
MKNMIFGVFMLLGLSTATFGEISQDRIEQLTKTLSADIDSEFNSLQDSQTVDSSKDEFYPIAHKYVNTEKINIRNAPVDGRIIGYLKRGKQVLIYDRKGEWERISKENETPKWVSSKLLCTGSSCYINTVQSSHSSYSSKLPLNTNRTSSFTSGNRAKSSAGLSSGSCPCSGVSNCVGPRGGIYCITSGGNKRYR